MNNINDIMNDIKDYIVRLLNIINNNVMSFFVNDIVNNMCHSQFIQIVCTIHYE